MHLYLQIWYEYLQERVIDVCSCSHKCRALAHSSEWEACLIHAVGHLHSGEEADQKELTSQKNSSVGWLKVCVRVRSGPGASCPSSAPKQKPLHIWDQECSILRDIISREKSAISHGSFHCGSLLLVLPAITAKSPQRSSEFLASFIKIARDRSVICWISADLSCSEPTSPRELLEIISPTTSATCPLDVTPQNSLKKVIDTNFSCNQLAGHSGFLLKLKCSSDLLESVKT